MGILVRLFLSLGGTIVGAAAFAAVFALIVAGGFNFFMPKYLNDLNDHDRFFVLGIFALGAGLSGIRGGIVGYKTGLKMGRDICFATEPEQNSRVEVKVSGESKKG